MIHLSRLGIMFNCLALPLTLFAAAYSNALAQGCSASSTPPPLNGQSWNDNGTKNVYIDSTLPSTMQAQIRQAAADFGAQTGQSHKILPTGSTDPGTGSRDAIRFLNNAPGSPTSFTHTNTADVYQNGVDTHRQISASTSFKTGANLAPASNGSPAVPFYDPNQSNASQYVHDTTLHKLGHAFGISDAPVPTDSATGNPDYGLRNAGASIMSGTININDQGPHGPTSQPVAGGVGTQSVCQNDKQQINTANPPAPPPPPTPAPGGGGSGSGSGGYSDGGGDCFSYYYEDWNDVTNSLTDYSGSLC